MEEQYYTVKELAALLKVSDQTILNWIEREGVPVIRLGRAIRVPESSVKQLVQPRAAA